MTTDLHDYTIKFNSQELSFAFANHFSLDYSVFYLDPEHGIYQLIVQY